MSLFSNFFGQPKQEGSSEIGTILDLITYAAGLASNPSDIDSILDGVRSITASLGPNEQLPPAQITTLIGIYEKLETYLTTREPIRIITKQSLRQRLSPTLTQQLSAFEAATQPEKSPNETTPTTPNNKKADAI